MLGTAFSQDEFFWRSTVFQGDFPSLDAIDESDVLDLDGNRVFALID